MQFPLVMHRLLLAVLLWFASTILLWTPIPSTLDWLMLIGYYALSAVLLDLAARFRARDLFALLTLAGIYGLLAALFIHPATALTDIPRTLFTRAMGAHALMGLIALVLYLRTRRAFVYRVVALIIGVAWAIWARWSPTELWGVLEPTPPFMLISALVIGIATIILVTTLTDQNDPPSDHRLSPLGWLVMSVIGAALLLLHAAQERIDGVTAVTILILAGFSTAILWFQKRAKGITLLDSAPRHRRNHLLETSALFLLGAVIGYLLPRTDPDGIAILVSLFAAYGVIWLPAVSIVLGGRAFARQARALKL